MAKRPLTEDERKLTKQGIHRMEKELESKQELLDALKAEKEFKEAKYKYEDSTRAYVRKTERDGNQKQIHQVKAQIKEVEESIKTSYSQLKEGVESKE